MFWISSLYLIVFDNAKTHEFILNFYRDFNPVTQQTNEGFQFPDSDYEEEGVKDGIVMFCGTVKAMKNAQENLHEIDIPISDDEEEEVQENFHEIESEDEYLKFARISKYE